MFMTPMKGRIGFPRGRIQKPLLVAKPIFSFTTKRINNHSSRYFATEDGSKSIVNLVQSGSPLERYHKLIELGEIKFDQHQKGVIEQFERLYNDTLSYSAPVTEMRTVITQKKREYSGFFSWLLNSSPKNDVIETVTQEKYREEAKNVPKGLYLYGDVGCGKTFLMDLFYSSCTHITRKQRIHFHNFMVEVHDRIHVWRQKKIKEQKERSSVQKLKKTKEELEQEAKDQDTDPIPPLADEFANRAYLLCFDEFQVTDIADAMILYRLFDHLFQRGVILVTTSNRKPDDLYKGGLQRNSFLPFIDLLKQKAIIYNINSGVDYRLTGSIDTQVYFSPITNESRSTFETLYESLTIDQKIEPVDIFVHGRCITINEATKKGVAKVTFNELCAQPLGAADYMAISKRFHTVFMSDIPKMTINQKSEAKRFIVLIDAFYENQVKLICLADAQAEEIFSHNPKDISFQANEMLDSLNITLSKSDITMFTGEEEIFQFQRAVSRLKEMQTMEYLEQGREHEKE